MTTYRIKDWDRNFEVSQSRKVAAMNWVAIPNKHDGKSYRRLMKLDRAGDIYTAWMLIVQVASKCPTRGVLADSDGPLTAEDLELKTGFSAECFELAFEALQTPGIAWVEAVGVDSQHATSGVVAKWEHATDTGQDMTGQNTTTTGHDSENASVVVDELIHEMTKAEFGGAARMVEKAMKSLGWSPLEIKAVFDWWCNHREAMGWKHGFLADVLKGRPGPPQTLMAVRATVVRSDPALEQAARDRERPRRLAAFGAAIDAMTRSERLSLLEGQPESVLRLASASEPSWKSSKITSDLMLEAIERQSSPRTNPG